ncbi:MAG: MFS transporter [Hyphomonadaceae bacterium]|nr:MFS transporter [Hyphomonadaceae bacterium]
MTAVDAPGAALPAQEMSAARVRYCLIVLTACWSLNMLDRQLLAIVAEPIRLELNLSDTQLGLLTGPMFAVLYSAAALPIAWMADRWHRVRILGACAIGWSVLTGAAGFATNFAQLAVARMTMSVAEAGCNPCSQALISDYVTPERRGRALGTYAMGIPLGLAAAGFIGGPLADAVGWRQTFIILGGASLVVALLVLFTLPEPARRAPARAPGVAEDAGFRALLRKPAFQHLMLAGAWGSTASYGALAWGIVFVVRYFEWTPGQVGAVFATLGAVSALIATWLGGFMGDRLAQRDARWLAWMPAIALLLVLPFGLVGAFAPLVLILLFTSPAEAFLRSLTLAPGYALLQRMTPPDARARAAAMQSLTATLVGLGLGPLMVGVVSDALAPSLGADSLRWGMAALLIPQALAAAHLWRAARTLRADVIE